MAADHALRRELSRRIRDDLIRLGIVAAGPAVRIADGAVASAGDLIICTRNDHTVEAGEPGRTLANGDLLRIDAVTPTRADRPPRAGRRPGHRAAAVDRPAVPVRGLPEHRAGLRGHRPRRPEPHRDRRPGRDHRHRGPPARLRRADPRHRRQHGVRVHRVPQASRPGARPAPGPRTGPLRPPHRRTRRSARHGGPGRRRARSAGRRAGPRWPAAVGVPDPAAGPGRRRSPGHPERDLDRRDHPRPRAALPGPARWLTCRPSTAQSPATGPGGYGGPCAPPNWPAWTPARSWPPRSANGTWPGPATWPPSSTPGSGTGLGALVPAPAGPWSAQVPAIADPERRAYADRDRRA